MSLKKNNTWIILHNLFSHDLRQKEIKRNHRKIRIVMFLCLIYPLINRTGDFKSVKLNELIPLLLCAILMNFIAK